MKKVQLFATTTALLLAGCGNLARNAADQTAVSVLPLAGAAVSGSFGASTALAGQALTSQATSTGTLTYTGKFDDFDPSSIPSLVGDPSGLDVPIKPVSLELKNCAGGLPGANTITLTLTKASLTVSDATHGSQDAAVNGTVQVPLTKTAQGVYTSSASSANMPQLLLNLAWAKFSAIVAKSGSNTPNAFTLSLAASANIQGPCDATVKLDSASKQYVRFQ